MRFITSPLQCEPRDDRSSEGAEPAKARRKRNRGYSDDQVLKTPTMEVDRLRRNISHAEHAFTKAQLTLREYPEGPTDVKARGQKAISAWLNKQNGKVEKQRKRVVEANVAYKKAVRQHILFCGVRQWYIDHLGYDAYFTRLLPQGYNDPKKVVAHFWDYQSAEVCRQAGTFSLGVMISS